MKRKNDSISKYLLNISEIAIITGHNKFKTRNEYLIEFWKKHNKEDFEKYRELTSFVKLSDEDKIKDISSKNNISITDELKTCESTTNINDLNNLKKNIMKKVENLGISEKKEILKSIDNLTNTNFGTRNETDVLKIYEELKGVLIVKDNIYRKKKIIENLNFSVCIGGKIDGINNDTETIIEIKNRMHKLFYDLREYEKVQLMCYMYLLNKKNGHLVEAMKKSTETTINIIEVEYDDNYMDTILQKIEEFCLFYYDFQQNHEQKINLLSGK
jgi:hypothetical protein